MEWRRVSDRVRNWDRWGPSDELGALNYITRAKMREASQCVKAGQSLSLAIPASARGPIGIFGSRRNPLHLMTELGADEDTATENTTPTSARFSDDLLVLHTHSVTHWDALAHCHYDGQLYNGYPASSITSSGAAKCSIASVAEAGHVASRGVLLDVAGHRETPWLPDDALISPEELQAVAETERIEIAGGDVVLIRTGSWGKFANGCDRTEWGRRQPGLSWRCAEWFHEREVAAVAADNLAVEAHDEDADAAAGAGFYLSSRESPDLGAQHADSNPSYLFHMLALRDMGLLLGELWNLEELAAVCTRDSRYDFMLIAEPLAATGAVGGPVNPIALR
jgi:kynurenine formamidase